MSQFIIWKVLFLQLHYLHWRVKVFLARKQNYEVTSLDILNRNIILLVLHNKEIVGTL